MNINNLTIILLLFTLVTLIDRASGNLYTSYWNVIPNSLKNYLSCSYGDLKCLNNKEKPCKTVLKICQESNSETISKNLIKNGYNIESIENFTPKNFCQFIQEVCNIIGSYKPPQSKIFIYDLNQYLTCKADDIINQKQEKNVKKQNFKKIKNSKKIKKSKNTQVTSFSSKIKKNKTINNKNQLPSRKKSKQKNTPLDKLSYQKQRQNRNLLWKIHRRTEKELNRYMRNNYIPVGDILEKYIINHIPERIRNLIPKKLPIKRTSLRNIRIFKKIIRNAF